MPDIVDDSLPERPISSPSVSRRGVLAGLAASAAAVSVSAFASGCSSVAPTGSTAAPGDAGFTPWSEAFAADWVRQSAEFATFTQYFTGEEQAAFDAQLTPLQPVQRQRRLALARRGLAQLQRFDEAALTPDERVGAAILRWSLQRTLDSAPFEDHGFVFSQLGGPHLRYVSLLAERHPLRQPGDLRSWMSRLSQVSLRLDEAILRCRDAAARGLLPPRFILERARTQVQEFLAQGEADNDIVSGLQRRSARLQGLAPDERERAIGQASALVQSQLRPAYGRVLALLDELRPRTTADAGLWRLPDGAAAYAQNLASSTTTAMDAEAIHALGLREVARIEAEMDRVLRQIGRPGGTVQARLVALRAELQPPAEPDPRPAILALYRDAVQDAQRRAQPLFNLQPRAPIEVRRVPALTERTASAHYTTPAPDGSQPGIFWLPMPGPDYDLLRVRSLAVHEAVPGHHLQLALQQEQASLPRWRQRRIFGGGSAHSEG